MQQKSLIAGKIPGVNLTRIVGALGILVFHFGCHCGWLGYLCNTPNYNWGVTWVTVFLATSGACLARTYSGELDIWRYFRRRWLGLFPMFFLAWIALAIIRFIIAGPWWVGIPKQNFLLTLIGMDGYFCGQMPTFYLCGEWFLGALVVCYAVFPLLRWLLSRIPLTTAAVLLVGAWYIPFLSCFERDPFNNLWTCVMIFYIGMLMAQYPRVTSHWSMMIACAIVLIVWTFVSLGFPMPLRLFSNILVGVVLYLLLNGIGALLERVSVLNAGLSHLGALSFPFFLMHHQLIYIVLVRLPIESKAQAFVALGYAFVLTFILAESLLIHHKALIKK